MKEEKTLSLVELYTVCGPYTSPLGACGGGQRASDRRGNKEKLSSVLFSAVPLEPRSVVHIFYLQNERINVVMRACYPTGSRKAA